MIDVANISVRFRNAPAPALSDISFSVEKGEHIAILGPNGSGKSTLMKVLCGIIPLEKGQIRILEKTVSCGGFGRDFFGDIGVVFQEPQGQFLGRDVRTEIMAILQNLGLPVSKQNERFDEIVAEFGLEHLLETKPENLSGGQMQLVNLASAVCIKPQILILDEPTTFLDPFYKADFLARINSFGKQGMTVIHITQYPDEALLASRILTLNSGNLVYDGPSSGFLNDNAMLHRNRLVKPAKLNFQMMFGFDSDDQRMIDDYINKTKLSPTTNKSSILLPEPVPIIQVKDLKYSYQGSNFSLDVPRLNLDKGEIAGLVGPAGSGKSTLAFLLAGLLKTNEGDISVAGKLLAEYKIDELRTQIGITWQLPDLTMIGPTVRDDLEFNLNDTASGNGMIASALHEVGLNGFEDRIVDTLSGGEKRKLALASILLANPKYLILDEPEAFLDPWSQQEMISVFRKIAGKERGILIIAHDLSFLSEITDRIIGLSDGKVAFDIPAIEFFSNSAYLHRLGLPINRMIEFRQKLADSGVQLKTSSLDPANLKQSL